MINRIDFTKNMKSTTSLQEIIIKYFDEVMALYDLVGVYENFSLEGNFDEKISFDLKFKSVKESKKFHNIINDITIEKYNRKFKCSVQHKDNTLSIYLD